MGMAASQARYLSLQARMSNVEYQGQQINQERTILSQQSTALYNSLLDMTVPTPPSTSDYTTVTYSGVDGATNFTLGNIKPQDGKYVVEINTSYTGGVVEKDSGVKKVGFPSELNPQNYNSLRGTELDPGATQYTKEVLSSIYVKTKDDEGKTLCRPLTSKDAGTLYTIDDTTGKITLLAGEGETPNEFFINDGKVDGDVWYVDPIATYTGYTIGGYYAYEFKDAEATFSKENGYNFDWDSYKTAITDTYGMSVDAKNYNDFYVYFDTTSGYPVPKFVLKNDLATVAQEKDNQYVPTYSYLANGTVQKTESKEQCELTFDTAGRITQIGIPQYGKDEKGNIDPTKIIGYNYIDLKASTSTDSVAYEDAYNQYEYAQYQYDKKVQEINAKTEIIQQEDRSLELRLQRLDNERTQLKTEMEAVEKVINENIENSYKTFSG